MTKAQRKQNQLEKHYASLVKLAELCGIKNADGKQLSVILLKIEGSANKSALNYCNGNLDTAQWDDESYCYEQEVQNLFNRNLKGLVINGDARGYTLKISDKIMIEEYKDTGLYKDWGGYGILAPKITGD